MDKLDEFFTAFLTTALKVSDRPSSRCDDSRILEILGNSCSQIHFAVINRAFYTRSRTSDIYARLEGFQTKFKGLAGGNTQLNQSSFKETLRPWLSNYIDAATIATETIDFELKSSKTEISNVLFECFKSQQRVDLLNLVYVVSWFELFLQVKRAFRIRHSGFMTMVTVADTQFFLSWLGLPLLKKDANLLMNLPTHEIEFPIFCHLFVEQVLSIERKFFELELRNVFDMMDTNSDDMLELEEIHRGLDLLGLSCSEDECEDLLQRFDSDGNGLLDFSEFVHLYKARLILT